MTEAFFLTLFGKRGGKGGFVEGEELVPWHRLMSDTLQRCMSGEPTMPSTVAVQV